MANLQSIFVPAYGIDSVLDQDGQIWVPGRSLEEMLGLRENSVRENWASKSLKPLLSEALASGKTAEIKTVNWHDSKGNPNRSRLYHLDACAVIIANQAYLGNTIALRLLAVGWSDSVRSITYELNGTRLEVSDREQYLLARLRGKVTRRTMTAAIRDYIADHPDAKPGYNKSVYWQITDLINSRVLGCQAKVARVLLGCPADGLLRDYLTEQQIDQLKKAEEWIQQAIDVDQIEPMRAAHDCLKYARLRQYWIT